MQGMNPDSSCDSGLLYRLWLVGGGLGPGSRGPSLYAPLCHQGVTPHVAGPVLGSSVLPTREAAPVGTRTLSSSHKHWCWTQLG